MAAFYFVHSPENAAGMSEGDAQGSWLGIGQHRGRGVSGFPCCYVTNTKIKQTTLEDKKKENPFKSVFHCGSCLYLPEDVKILSKVHRNQL